MMKELRESRVMSIDPGVDIGFATWDAMSGDLRVWQARLTHDQFIQELNEFWPDVIVCESFNHRHKMKVDYTPVEYIGLVKWFVERKDVDLYFQTSAFGKEFPTDRLKHLGLYVPGDAYEDSMVALKHLLQFRIKHNLFDLRLLK